MSEDTIAPASKARHPVTAVPAARAVGIETAAVVGPANREHADGSFRAEFPANLASARQARAAVRQALSAWGMDDPGGDAELLASELVANAAEHAAGQPIGFTLRRHAEPGGRPGITCEVTDTSPAMPRARQAGLDAERGRGLAIVGAIATGSGVRPGPAGKTSWFTLALSSRDRAACTAQPARPEPEAEAEAGG